ncbi:MAG: branched-chain amino acid transaminase [Thermomicrobiales bacterium]|nr:branched-chain amino acid transaminase [Thermomicrobiales bacterium]MCO5222546.1 branched-chain amino acid transaminase [Thermomicrobiales bacterium]
MHHERPSFLWYNGKMTPWDDATIHVSEMGWSTIGAVFEGIRGYWNEDQGELHIYRLREHMERLQRSMKLVHLPLDYSVDELIEATVELARVNDCRHDTYFFPMAYTADTYFARFDGLEVKTSLQILTRPLPSHLGGDKKMHAKISSWRRISEDVMPPRVKNLSNYRNGQLARQEVGIDGYDTAILLNTHGKVSEGPGACVMLVRDGKLITPDLTSGILESITRDAILVLAREVLGIPVEERVVDRTELYVADEVFLCGTAAEISPIVSVDRYPIGDGNVGLITRELDRVYEASLRATDSSYAEWRTPVGLAATVPA